ncbi:hypothetical protein L7F22_039213 [Adiantum nelumboides]|nr:hypothetical protein [Adiantum nelumboides]
MSAEASSSKNVGPAGGVGNSNVNGAGPSSFATAQDYIPFDFGEEEEVEEQQDATETLNGKDEKGKRKSEKEKSKKEKKKSKSSKESSSADRKEDKASNREDKKSKESGRKRKREAEKPESSKSSNQRKKEKRQTISGTPWSVDVDFDRCLNAAEALHNELIAFADWISPTEREHECRRLVVQLIRRAIVREWPDAHLEAFGSQNTQLYMPSGDLDLVVVSQAMESQRKENVLRKMAAVLRRHNLAMDVQVIARAKVPIVKFVCVHGKLKVDISINQTNGIEAANYIRGWLDRLPSIRPLIMAVKLLLVQRGLSEVFSGGLGSYSVICLVINHLQMHPKIQRGELDPALNLGILFLEFLELYGRNFGYDNVGISIRGRGQYFTKVSRGWRDDRRPFMLSIEDPLDPSNDISKGSYAIISVRQAFAGAYDILSAALSQRANEIKKRKAAEHWGDGVKPIDEDEEARAAILNVARNPSSSSSNKDPESLLGSVIGIPHEMFKSRRDLEQLWQSGIMQNKLGRKPPAAGSPEPSDLSRKGTPGVSESSKSNNYSKKEANANVKKNGGSRSDPVIVEDNSVDNNLKRSNGYQSDSNDSVLMMDEEELAASQGYQFSSGHRNDADYESENNKENAEVGEEPESRYTETATKRGKQADGLLGRRSRLDAFAEQAPRRFVNDDEDSDGSSDHEEGEILNEKPSSSKRARTDAHRRSGSAEERRKRKDEYWAGKGNAVGTGALSPDDEHASDPENQDEEEEDVLLNVYD